ncbi:MAG: Bug family tripartite tricarboxylate transporter substrate binding protein [Hyphomicrobiaceae bacterium]
MSEDFYKGKTITVFVGNGPASGFDAYARLLTRHMARHIPGNPNFVVQHMPGAGGAKVNEYVARIAPKDGTAFAITMPGSLVQPLIMGADKFRYDPKALAFIGNADSGTRICIIKASTGVKSFEQTFKKELTLGSTAPGGSMFDYPKFTAELLGSKFKIITGYKGSPQVMIATERGETDGVCGLDISTLKSIKPDWVNSPDFNIIIQVGPRGGATNKELDKRGVPSLWKFVPKDKIPVVELITSQQFFHRPFFAPPGTPAAQLKTLRTAFLATLSDPETQKEAEKMRLALEPTGGEELGKAIVKMYGAPKELVAQMAKAIAP